MKVIELLETTIKDAVYSIYGIEAPLFVVEHPENEDFGNYSTNVAFVVSKMVKQSPVTVANAICSRILDVLQNVSQETELNKLISSVTVLGSGFINIILKQSWLQNVLYDIYNGKNDYGVLDIGDGKVVALEHSNVNPNKAAHVGHLRNACIGQFIERVYEKLGYNVIVQYYDNDLGVQVTTSLMGTEKLTEIKAQDYDKYDHYAWDVYAKMESLIANDPLLAQERAELLARLENSADEISIKQEALSSKILLDQLKTFTDVGFEYDVVVRERDIINLKFWDAAFEKLKKCDNVYLATEGASKGCWLLKMPSNKTENVLPDAIEGDKILVRSNGVPTYTGKDIAYHMWKFGLIPGDFYYKKFSLPSIKKSLWITQSIDSSDVVKDITFKNASIILNVIDVKQTYAMEAVKISLLALGYKEQAENMHHINYGFVHLSKETAQGLGIDTSDGKEFYGMSGRKGWGVKIDDLIKLVDTKLVTDYGDFGYVREVRNGAIRFQMLKSNTFQDLVFDLPSALDIKGYTGPYIQYSYVRANSIITKMNDNITLEHCYDITADAVEFDLQDREKALLRYIYRFPEVLLKSANEFAPNILCEFLFELSKRFNSLYNDLPILSEKDASRMALRIALTNSFKTIVKDGLNILGIDVAEKM